MAEKTPEEKRIERLEKAIEDLMEEIRKLRDALRDLTRGAMPLSPEDIVREMLIPTPFGYHKARIELRECEICGAKFPVPDDYTAEYIATEIGKPFAEFAGGPLDLEYWHSCPICLLYRKGYMPWWRQLGAVIKMLPKPKRELIRNLVKEAHRLYPDVMKSWEKLIDTYLKLVREKGRKEAIRIICRNTGVGCGLLELESKK